MGRQLVLYRISFWACQPFTPAIRTSQAHPVVTRVWYFQAHDHLDRHPLPP